MFGAAVLQKDQEPYEGVGEKVQRKVGGNLLVDQASQQELEDCCYSKEPGVDIARYLVKCKVVDYDNPKQKQQKYGALHNNCAAVFCPHLVCSCLYTPEYSVLAQV